MRFFLMGSASLLLLTSNSTLLAESRGPEMITSEELFEIREMNVKELIEVISTRQTFGSVMRRPRAVNPYVPVSTWTVAKKALRLKFPAARKSLISLLDHEQSFSRSNALELLGGDDVQSKIEIKDKVLQMLEDPIISVQIQAVRFLSEIKDQEIEMAIIGILKKFRLKENSPSRRLHGQLVESLCLKPINRERVVLTMVDEIRRYHSASTRIFWSIATGVRKLPEVKAHRHLLYEPIWEAWTHIEDSSLLSLLAESFPDDDPETLKFLRKMPTQEGEQSRRYAAYKLIAHQHFNPLQEIGLFQKLFNDRSATVRIEVIATLSVRKDLPVNWRIDQAMKAATHGPSEKVKITGIAEVLEILAELDFAPRQKLISDRSEVYKLMVGSLEDPRLAKCVTFNSEHVVPPSIRKLKHGKSEAIENWWKKFDPDLGE